VGSQLHQFLVVVECMDMLKTRASSVCKGEAPTNPASCEHISMMGLACRWALCCCQSVFNVNF
jgi:hypothetical protein